MTTIVDYGMGNLGSIQNMLKKLGEASIITSDPYVIEQADRLILPGVGAFDSGMIQLNESNLITSLNKRVLQDKVPILGICLGIQLMTKSSMEGKLNGLGWFDAHTIKFEIKEGTNKYVLPNMGWRKVAIRKEIPLFKGLEEDSWFYFVHNYHLVTDNEGLVSMTSEYGYDFVVSLNNENILGVQFHPEKSHKYGLRLLQNFINYY
jgi:glutamine amidotransferase